MSLIKCEECGKRYLVVLKSAHIVDIRVILKYVQTVVKSK